MKKLASYAFVFLKYLESIDSCASWGRDWVTLKT